MARFVVAITGGVASGKSTVCARFAAHGIEVIDADLVARELVEPEQPALAEIARRFGQRLLDEDGRLQRRYLRQIIFRDPAARADLEAILHPLVHAVLVERAGQAVGPYVVLAIPLLTETGQYRWVDRIVVVDVDPATQVRRLLLRDGIDETQAQQMLAAQATRAERLALASDVIVNDADLDTLNDRVDTLHAEFLAAARR